MFAYVDPRLTYSLRVQVWRISITQDLFHLPSALFAAVRHVSPTAFNLLLHGIHVAFGLLPFRFPSGIKV